MRMPIASRTATLALSCLGVFLYGYFSEKFPWNDGLGFHPESWAIRVREFHDIWEGKASLYEIQRMLPTFILHAAFSLFGKMPTNAEILHAATTFYSACYAGIFIYWHKTCTRHEIPLSGEFVGILALGLNGLMKNNMFYPTMIYDNFGLLLGMAMTYYWLANRAFALFVVMLLFTFTTPQGAYTSLVLLLFPARQATETAEDKRARLSPWMATPLCIAILVPCAITMALTKTSDFNLKINGYSDAHFQSLSIFIILVFLALASFPILIKNPFTRAMRDVNIRSIVTFALGLGFLVVISKIQNRMASPAEYPYSYAYILFFYYLRMGALDSPGFFIINKMVSFGPIVLIAALYWKEYVQAIFQRGFGAVFLTSMFLLRIIETESRHHVDIFPFCATLLLISTYAHFTTRRIVFFAFLSFILSKTWMSFSVSFPEYYFWSFGSFFSSSTGYYIQLVFCLFAVAATLLVFNKGNAASYRPTNRT